MFCRNCGKEVADGQKFCSFCGANISPTHEAYDAAKQAFNNAEKQLDNVVNDFRGTGGGPGYDAPQYGERLQTDRSLAMYIILTLVTCGIYSYYFIYKMAKDVNIACEGDGESTGGLVQFILLSAVTCGIYAWFWYYKLGNRLATNAPRYGMAFQENGTTVLMWLLFGSLLCGIGSFVAMNILIKNTNSICHAYNKMNGMY